MPIEGVVYYKSPMLEYTKDEVIKYYSKFTLFDSSTFLEFVIWFQDFYNAFKTEDVIVVEGFRNKLNK